MNFNLFRYILFFLKFLSRLKESRTKRQFNYQIYSLPSTCITKTVVKGVFTFHPFGILFDVIFNAKLF